MPTQLIHHLKACKIIFLMIYHVIYKKIWFSSAETKREEKKWLPFWKRPPSWIFNSNLFEIWVECAEDLNGRFLREKTSLLLKFLILILFYLFSGGHFQKLPPVVKKMKISEVRISTFHRKIPIYIWSKFDAFPFNLNSFPAKPLKFVEISYKNYLTPYFDDWSWGCLKLLSEPLFLGGLCPDINSTYDVWKMGKLYEFPF